MSAREDALQDIVNLEAFPLDSPDLAARCAGQLAATGVVTLPGFLLPETIRSLVAEAEACADQAFYTASTHNVYLTRPDTSLPPDHVFNRQVVSTKGCICTDQVPAGSALHRLYNAPAFRAFVASVVGEDELHEYADSLSSINVHYAPAGKELNWHFDNSEFAITLLLQRPEAGGAFEYVKDLRDAEKGEMNFAGVQDLLDGRTSPEVLTIEPGTLVLFRGRNSIHRVTPTIGPTKRILVVLAYNSRPGIALSESARRTFYGRLGEVAA
jgi:hypothetical protein